MDQTIATEGETVQASVGSTEEKVPVNEQHTADTTEEALDRSAAVSIKDLNTGDYHYLNSFQICLIHVGNRSFNSCQYFLLKNSTDSSTFKSGQFFLASQSFQSVKCSLYHSKI